MSKLLPSSPLEVLAEKIIFDWNKQLSLFFGLSEESFWTRGKKTLKDIGKKFMRLTKPPSFLPEGLFEGESGFFCEKNSSIGIIIPQQKKFRFPSEHFQQNYRKTMPLFQETFWAYFFSWKKSFSFSCSFKQFREFGKNSFCSAVKTTFFVSGENSGRTFFRKKINCNIFFRTLSQRFPVRVGELLAVFSEMLVSLPGSSRDKQLPCKKVFVFWTFSKLSFFSQIWEESLRTSGKKI